jgi:hypothetical protein
VCQRFGHDFEKEKRKKAIDSKIQKGSSSFRCQDLLNAIDRLQSGQLIWRVGRIRNWHKTPEGDEGACVAASQEVSGMAAGSARRHRYVQFPQGLREQPACLPYRSLRSLLPGVPQRSDIEARPKS